MRHEWFTAWADQRLGVNVMLARVVQLSDGEVFAAFGADPATVQVLSLDPGRRRSGHLPRPHRTVRRMALRGRAFHRPRGERRCAGPVFRDGATAFAPCCTQEMVGFQSADDGRVTTRCDLGCRSSGTVPTRIATWPR